MKEKREAALLYKVWYAMNHRCYNPKNVAHERYGGRNITVCDRWLEDYHNFILDMGTRPAGTSLDRIDNDGDYEPSNCRWATNKEQCENRRMFKNNKSGHPGVSFHPASGKWQAFHQVDGKPKYIGIFKMKEEAIMARHDLSKNKQCKHCANVSVIVD